MSATPETQHKNKTMTWHVDLHETTDTDATEFMPAKHAKAGLDYDGEAIPDGFYLVTDIANPQLAFQKAILTKVQAITHLAPPDPMTGTIIDVPLVAPSVIAVAVQEWGLCCSFTGAPYVTTTEVYPDSPKATDDICNLAQVAALQGAMEYILENNYIKNYSQIHF